MQLIACAANWAKLNLKVMKIHWVFVENSAKFFYLWILYSLQSKLLAQQNLSTFIENCYHLCLILASVYKSSNMANQMTTCQATAAATQNTSSSSNAAEAQHEAQLSSAAE